MSTLGSRAKGRQNDAESAAGGHIVPYTIHAAESCAKERHAFATDTARSIDSTGAFASNQGGTLAANGAGVRRLTPRECERLQGLPDDWTLIQWQGKPAPDSRRYAAVGDAVTVNAAEWIGARLMAAVRQRVPA